MDNRATFSAADLLSCFGDAAAALPSTFHATGVSTDTRTLEPGSVFVALRGEHFDGHEHVEAAFLAGARLCIVEADNPISRTKSHEWLASNKPIIMVPSTLHALGTLGWYHRRRFAIPVVAVAGSAGKTSTKELTAHVLSENYTVLKTQANYNNRIGTPLTLLQLDESHTAAVIEIGTNEPGEIELLAAMVQPTHGIITQIGKEHLEKLIDLDGVEREETALFEYLRDHDGVLLVNADDQRLRSWYARNGGKGLTFSVDSPADFQVQLSFNESLNPSIHHVAPDGGMRATMSTVGLAAGLNAIAAFAVGKALGMHVAQIKHGLESYQPPAVHGYARMVVERIDGFSVLNDTYNANPESMAMALRTLAQFPSTTRIAVLGDMRELGDAAHTEHVQILELAVQVADAVLTVGSEFAQAATTYSSVHVCPNASECVAVLRTIATAGAAILVKGSRGIQMEQVITELKGA